MEISVVIPAYNEEKRLPSTLEKTIDYLKSKEWKYEIIVVDDGSMDGTRDVASKYLESGVRLTPSRANKGKGGSVKEGMLLAKNEWVLFMDADNSTPASSLDKFIPYLEEYDVLIGSRNLPGSEIVIKQPFLRSILGKGFPLLVRMLVVRGIKDTQCGFKLFRKKCITQIFEKQTLDKWGFDVEILFIARKKGYRIKEIPIKWWNDGESKVSAFRATIEMFFDLFKIRMNSIRGKYT